MLTLKTFLEHYHSSTIPDEMLKMVRLTTPFCSIDDELHREIDEDNKANLYYDLSFDVPTLCTGSVGGRIVKDFDRKAEICREYITNSRGGTQFHVINIQLSTPIGYTYVPEPHVTMSVILPRTKVEDIMKDVRCYTIRGSKAWKFALLDVTNDPGEKHIAPLIPYTETKMVYMTPKRITLSNISIVHCKNDDGTWRFWRLAPGWFRGIPKDDWTGLEFNGPGCLELLTLEEARLRRITEFE